MLGRAGGWGRSGRSRPAAVAARAHSAVLDLISAGAVESTVLAGDLAAPYMSCTVDDEASAALQVMAERRLPALLVVDRAGCGPMRSFPLPFPSRFSSSFCAMPCCSPSGVMCPPDLRPPWWSLPTHLRTHLGGPRALMDRAVHGCRMPLPPLPRTTCDRDPGGLRPGLWVPTEVGRPECLGRGVTLLPPRAARRPGRDQRAPWTAAMAI